MGGKNSPKAPDYTAAAQAQGQASKEVTNMQTWANRPDQNTPFGNVSWAVSPYRDPATGQSVTKWTQNMSLSPDTQAALDAQTSLTRGRSELAQAMLDRASNEFGPMVDWNSYQDFAGVPNVPDYNTSGLYEVQDPSRYRANAENAIYSSMTSRLDPRYAQESQALESKLRNQGLRPGDEAYDTAMANFGREKTDAYQQAMNAAVTGGREEALGQYGMDTGRREQQLSEMLRTGSQGFQQNMSAAGYANTLRQGQIAEEMQRRGYTLNEINAILSGQQIAMPSMPNFNAASRADPTQYLAAAQMTGQSNLDRFNAEQAAMQGMMQGIGSMGSAFMPM